MLSDKLNEDKFDETLRRALRGHTEPVPTDFTAGLLRQIEQAQERRILARVVLEAAVPFAMMQLVVAVDIREEPLVARTAMQGAGDPTITVRKNQVKAVRPVTMAMVRS